MTGPRKKEFESGTVMWELPNGNPHREDGPAVVHPDGSESWFRHGEFHRVDGPAITKADGTKEWWRNGQRHRDGGPALVYPDGRESWYLNGEFHRADGPAIVRSDGGTIWYLHGQMHRDGGPAELYADGSERWYWHGKLHRVDGPARCDVGDSVRFWYIEGHIVDVEGVEPGALKRAREWAARKDHFFSPESSANMLDYSQVHTTLFLRAFLSLQQNVDVSMLGNSDSRVAAVAAWRVPVDDDYLTVACNSPLVRTIMSYRDDVPAHVRALVEVAA